MTAPICERHEEFMAVNQDGYICLSCLADSLLQQERDAAEPTWTDYEADVNDYKMSHD